MPVPSVNWCSSFGTSQTVPIYISGGPDMSGVTGGLTFCQLRSCFSWIVHQGEEDVEGAIQQYDFFIFFIFFLSLEKM